MYAGITQNWIASFAVLTATEDLATYIEISRGMGNDGVALYLDCTCVYMPTLEPAGRCTQL